MMMKRVADRTHKMEELTRVNHLLETDNKLLEDENRRLKEQVGLPLV